MRKGTYRISCERFWHQIKKDFDIGGDVYELYCMMPNTEVEPVSRMLKVDLHGTLYIGMAASFINRVIELKKSISPKYKSSGHECGVKYKELRAIHEKYPFEHLFVELHGTKQPRELEQEKFQKYYKEFGELPPLNREG